MDAARLFPEEGAINKEPQEIICAEGDVSEHPLACPSVSSLTIKCNGTFAIVETVCPIVRSEPSCSMLLSTTMTDSDFCTIVNYTDSAVTCRCSLASSLRDLRLLGVEISNASTGGSETSGKVSVSYVSMLTAVTGSFLTTVTSATKLNTSIAAKGWQAIATLGTLCVFVASAIMFAHLADQEVKKKVAAAIQIKVDGRSGNGSSTAKLQHNNSILGRIVRLGSTAATPKVRPDEEMKKWQTKRQPHQNRYLSMAEEALPKVLLSSKSLSMRFIEEIKRHHRWIGVIYYFSKKFPRVLRILSLASNIVVMLFIQSLTYDLTKGDDGSCASFKSEERCLEPRSQYSSSISRCYWVASSSDTALGSGSCHYIQPDSSLTVVVFVAVFSALLSTPIALLVDWIIQNILSVPTTKEGISVDKKTASVAPMVSLASAVAPQNFENESLQVKRQKRQSAKQRISYLDMATLDCNNLHRELQEYRKEYIEDEKDRKEFDCKCIIDVIIFLQRILQNLCLFLLCSYHSGVGSTSTDRELYGSTCQC
jgi:hypothetical protein